MFAIGFFTKSLLPPLKSGMQTMPQLAVLSLVYMSGGEFTMKHDPAFRYYTNSCMTCLFGSGGISQDNSCTP